MIGSPETHSLLLAIVMICVVSSVIWLCMATVARIAPQASYCVAAANLAQAASIALLSLSGRAPDAWTQWPSDMLGVTSFVLLHHGVQRMTRGPASWPLTLGSLLTVGLALAWLPGVAQTALALLASAGFALAAAASLRSRPLTRNDAERYAFVLWAPLLLTGLLLALRGLELGFFPGTVAAVRGLQLLDDSFLWIVIVVALLQNTSLAFLVLLRLVLRIQQLHESDVLTGALNRRAFEAALVRAHHDARRDEPYALVMLDMDHFKRLNDNLGHAAGDAALRLMVQAVSPCLREVDRLGRLGGEEFAVLLPRTSLAGAALVADRMRTLLAERAFDWKGQAWPLSASFGIAAVEPGDANAEAVLARADAGLYLAKAQGRNIVQSV
ncbi:GGDEF domain-containing protein [Roseateles sp.]|uniref:GGDEF domain-containing protein n=1 Tax=Roseateles sp. TaxID=1971397 RepID=UPI003958FE7B